MKPKQLEHGQKITTAQAQGLAKRAGYVALKISQVKAAADLGKYCEQGVIGTLPATILVDAYERIKRGLDDCEAVVANSDDPEVQAGVLNAKRDFVAQMLSVAKTMTQVVVIKDAIRKDAAPKRQSFAAGQAVQPVQNVQVNVAVAPDGLEPCQPKSILNQTLQEQP